MKLLPCPFCGGSAELDTRMPYRALSDGSIRDRIAVYCTSCNADIGDSATNNNVDSIIEMWNSRNTDDLIVLLIRLVRLARKCSPDSDLPDLAMEYLKNNGITITPHRSSI